MAQNRDNAKVPGCENFQQKAGWREALAWRQGAASPRQPNKLLAAPIKLVPDGLNSSPGSAVRTAVHFPSLPHGAGTAMPALEANLAKANKYLARFRDGCVLNQIGGEAVPASDGATFDTISPVDLKLLAKVAHGKAADVDRAAKAAKRAFAGWAALPGEKRKQVLHKVADAIVARAEEIAFVECMDTGQALKFMAKAALRGAENFRFFADRAPEARDGKALRADGQINMTTRVPIGPVGIITPWNTPFMLSTWKIAPALAAGCTVVHKPAELAPLTARLLVEIAEEAGIPPGVWNVVNGMGEDAGKALTEHPDIKAIGFVGESRTGSLIMRQGADTLKRVHFELGGKNPVIVFADADLERAADAAVFMIYSLNGERCTSPRAFWSKRGSTKSSRPPSPRRQSASNSGTRLIPKR
jgi:5-carboxymethyl-2-hydroxymuconic-semialdehyde dehydrogenase